MTLTSEQQQAVSNWVAAGDNLSVIQKKLSEQFKISMTYMDVRFLVDDLNLALKDAAPKADASDVSKPAATGAEKAKTASNLPPDEMDEADAPLPSEDEFPENADLDEALPPDAGPSSLSVTVDKVTLLPGAIASGTVTFSDGVTGKWIVDNYGRPGFTEVSKPGYRPSAADAQAFMQELSAALQKRGY
ncbi:MAG: hypothetical protein QM715_20830 [Nibricoccus sp.]